MGLVSIAPRRRRGELPIHNSLCREAPRSAGDAGRSGGWTEIFDRDQD